MKTHIYLIRHGITVGNRDGLFYGATDYPLVEEGYRALREMTEQGVYPGGEGASFYVSGLIRCEQTLETIYGKRDFTVIPGLKEINCGIYEGVPFKDIDNIPEYAEWKAKEDPDIPMPGGESLNEFYDRTNAGFDELKAYHDEKGGDSIAVIHGAVICSLMSRLFGDGIGEGFWKWLPMPGRGYDIVFEDGRPAGYERIGR